MRRLLDYLVRLYPQEWRHRYEDEFHALLDDVPLRWMHVFDVARGAVSMRMRSPLAILTIGLIAGAVLGGVSVITRGEVFESEANVLVDAREFLRLDENGRPQALDRVLEPLSSRERERVAIEFRVELAGGTPVPRGRTLLRLSGRNGTAAAAQRLVQRLVDGVEGVTKDAVVVNEPSLPSSPKFPRLPATFSVLGVVNSAAQGLLIGYLWLLFASWIRRLRGTSGGSDHQIPHSA